jgi:hypothetical protein
MAGDRKAWGVLVAAGLALAPAAARAEIAVSANDGKAVLEDGVTKTVQNPPPDTVSIIDLSASPPKEIAEVQAPASVVGPPFSVAVAPDESFALVTGATKVDPNDATKTVPDDKLSVIDLKASPPKVSATLQAGLGAAGVSINRAGTLALVANRNEGTVSVFTIANGTLTPAGKVKLGDEKSGPSAVVFTKDGASALVTRDGDSRISVLSVEGSKVEATKRDIFAGLRPYSIDMAANGEFAVVGNVGMGAGDADTISVIDLQAKPTRVVGTATVGQTPEGLKISPDSQYVAVTVMNGSNKPKSSPFFNDKGLLRVYRIGGAEVSKVAETAIGHWCQGAAWSKDSKTLLVQCMVEKEITAFRFNGNSLERIASIKMNGGPSGIRTAEP